jgi:NAD(P)-dependent dehydrogenase (short-subunit alcohol dehydrogenase family)
MSPPWTAADIPEQRGRVAVVTGSNTGLGFQTARLLAERGATVVLAVRDLERGRQAAERIAASAPSAAVRLQRLDLASLASVREAAAELVAQHPAIDLLINNAGVMYPPRQTTVDGFELAFGINHLGHFALTGLLLPALLPVAGSRVVTVSSIAHRVRAGIHFDDLQLERGFDRMKAYGQSKLANLLFTYELQRRLAPAGTTSALAAHPGASNTELIRNSPTVLRALARPLAPIVAQSAARGALTTLRAATDPAALGGQYYGPDGVAEMRGHPTLVSSSAQSHDPDIQRRLWAVSEELTGVRYPV